ncbi:MAG: DUF1697 domain-containing protein [Betaproteobacteria bacterium]|nr:DUF1697 domain-containing protein [Betaproteobacteria bacterium]
MTIWIALLRGINVGGNHLLPMKRLMAIIDSLGGSNARTYIQSGNVVFEHKIKSPAKLERAIADAVDAEFGFAPRVLLIPADALVAAAEGNPYPQADAEPKNLHLYFLESLPVKPDIATMKSLAVEGEQFTLRDQVFYLHARDGIGKSKLAERVERLLGVAATARNWRTVTTLVEMSRG